MSIDFPASPLTGTIYYDPASGTEWRYDGQGWVRSGVSSPENFARLDLPNNFHRANAFEDDVTFQQDISVLGATSIHDLGVTGYVDADEYRFQGVRGGLAPAGGLTNQLLAKNSAADFDFKWANIPSSLVPTGGGPGQVLTKLTGADYDAGWLSPVGLVPLGGTINQVLAKASATDRDLKWYDLPHDLPPGGATNQMLVKTSGVDRVVGWVTPPVGLPPAGSLGYVLTKRTATDYDVNWQALPTFSGLAAGTIADQKAATSATVASTPGRQKYDPRHAKAICIWAWNGTTLTNYYTMGATMSRSGVGAYHLTLSPAAVNLNYLGCHITCGDTSNLNVTGQMKSLTTTGFDISITRGTGSGPSATDPAWGIATVYGDFN